MVSSMVFFQYPMIFLVQKSSNCPHPPKIKIKSSPLIEKLQVRTIGLIIHFIQDLSFSQLFAQVYVVHLKDAILAAL